MALQKSVVIAEYLRAERTRICEGSSLFISLSEWDGSFACLLFVEIAVPIER